MKSVDEILENCERYETTGSCWTWLRGQTSDGYGTVYFNGKNHLLHRLMHEVLVGQIPEDMEIHHVCHNKICCNPAHWDLLTRGAHTQIGDGVSARNRAKTHCPKGHPLSGDNVFNIPPDKKMPNGGRFCRTCKREANNAAYQRKKLKEGRTGIDNAEKTHCVHGHPFSPENTRVSAEGKRSCITCSNVRSREFQRQKRLDNN